MTREQMEDLSFVAAMLEQGILSKPDVESVLPELDMAIRLVIRQRLAATPA